MCITYILHYSVFGLQTVFIKQSAVHIYFILMFQFNKWVFSSFLKFGIDGVVRMDVGRVF